MSFANLNKMILALFIAKLFPIAFPPIVNAAMKAVTIKDVKKEFIFHNKRRPGFPGLLS